MNLLPPGSGLSQSGLLFLFIILILGLWIFVKIAQKRQHEAGRLKTFFLGGANIGPEFTEHNTLGTTFAWSGGTWFFVTVAYSNGPWVVLLQLPWCFSIILLALWFRRILPATRNRTLHGFLASRYGAKTQALGALATSIGYIINSGFEIFWGSLLFATSLSRPDLIVPVAFLLAILTGLYCSIGGYISNVKTDKVQNLLGVVALALLLFFVILRTPFSKYVTSASIIFIIGSVVYVLLSSMLPRYPKLQSNRFQSRTAIIFAIIAIVVAVLLWIGGVITETDKADSFLLKSSLLPIPLLVGLLSFQLFFNAIDMSNWQQIAANGDIAPEQHNSIKWSIIRASLYLLWFPALGGTLLGCTLRALSSELTSANIFAYAFNQVIPSGGQVLRGLVLGFIFLGFIATSLSTADTLLMSATQTLSYDIFWRKRLNKLLANELNIQDEYSFVNTAKKLLIPIALLMVGVFWLLYISYKGEVLNFQAMMYAWALSLFFPVFFAFYQPRKAEKNSIAVFWGIAVGLTAVTFMFFLALRKGIPTTEKDWLLNLMPIVSNGTSLIAYLIGIAIRRIFRERLTIASEGSK